MWISWVLFFYYFWLLTFKYLQLKLGSDDFFYVELGRKLELYVFVLSTCEIWAQRTPEPWQYHHWCSVQLFCKRYSKKIWLIFMAETLGVKWAKAGGQMSLFWSQKAPVDYWAVSYDGVWSNELLWDRTAFNVMIRECLVSYKNPAYTVLIRHRASDNQWNHISWNHTFYMT